MTLKDTKIQNPYNFLKYYDPEESNKFFGRDKEIDTLLSDIIISHLVILFATSGCGKTSLIKAGVFPRLEELSYATLYVRVKTDPGEAVWEELQKYFLFDWEKIQGSPDKRMKDFLSYSCGLDWAKNAKVEKIEADKAIKIYCDSNNETSLLLKKKETCVYLKRDNVIIDKFSIDTKNKDVVYKNILPFLFAWDDISGYLFRWDEVPGNDTDKLEAFLKQKVGWVKTTQIEKIDNNTIKISSEINFITLKLNDERNEISLEFHDGSSVKQIDKFTARNENGTLYIYLPEIDNDNELLLKLLKNKYDFGWSKSAPIEKINNGNTIKVYAEKETILLELNEKKTNVCLKIGQKTLDELVARNEEGKINIYEAKSLEEMLRNIVKVLKKPVVVFFDQFEEFFKIENKKQQKDFISNIGKLYRDRDSGVYTVFSMREEFFVEMDIFRDEIPSIFHNNSSLRLRPFTEKQAREAIVKPTEKDLPKFIWDDISEKGNEKFLEFLRNEYAYKFSWDGIPGKENARLKEFLKRNFSNVEWIDSARIEKINDIQTKANAIRIFDEKKYISIELNEEKSKVTVEIADDKPREFITGAEKTPLSVYEYGIDWLNKARIEKNKDGKQITIFIYKDSFSLTLNTLSDKESRVDLSINGGSPQEFATKIENGKLIIYREFYEKKMLDKLLSDLIELARYEDGNISYSYNDGQKILDKNEEDNRRIQPAHLQIVCDTLWKKREKDRIEMKYYDELEGAKKIMDNRLAECIEGKFNSSQLELFKKLLPKLRNNDNTKNPCGIYDLERDLNSNAAPLRKILEILDKEQFLNRVYYKNNEFVEWMTDYLAKRTDFLLLRSMLEYANKKQKEAEKKPGPEVSFAKDRYLFCWDEIPVAGNAKLLDFLMYDFIIDRGATTKIDNIDKKRIMVSEETKSISLILNEEKTKVYLEIDGVKISELASRTEDKKLNIYKNYIEPFLLSLEDFEEISNSVKSKQISNLGDIDETEAQSLFEAALLYNKNIRDWFDQLESSKKNVWSMLRDQIDRSELKNKQQSIRTIRLLVELSDNKRAFELLKDSLDKRELSSETIKELWQTSYSFTWDEIPGNDIGRLKLIEFLNSRYNAGLSESVEMEKSSDGKNIIINSDKKKISLINTNENRIELKNGNEIYELIGRMENGRLNVYHSPITSSRAIGILMIALYHEEIAPQAIGKLRDISTNEAVDALEYILNNREDLSRTAWKSLEIIADRDNGQISTKAREILAKQSNKLAKMKEREVSLAGRINKDEAWRLILKQIGTGECIPIIGPGVFTPAKSKIAEEWSEEFKYPIQNSRNLQNVIQFMSLKYDPDFPRMLMSKRIKEREKSNDPIIYRILADLPFKIYITTNYDDILFETLKDERDLFCWEEEKVNDDVWVKFKGFEDFIKQNLNLDLSLDEKSNKFKPHLVLEKSIQSVDEIKVSDGKNFISLELKDEQNQVILRIEGGKTYYFSAKSEKSDNNKKIVNVYRRKKNPRKIWRQLAQSNDPILAFTPTIEEPAVIYINGYFETPESLILTQEDLVKPLEISRTKDIHDFGSVYSWLTLIDWIKKEISKASFLFFGYSFEDWEFRTIFDNLLKNEFSCPDSARKNIFVTETGNYPDINKEKSVLDNFLGMYNINAYNGWTGFTEELNKKWNKISETIPQSEEKSHKEQRNSSDQTIHFKPQYYPGNTIIAKNRRKFISDNLEKLRDLSDEDHTAILGHRAPGSDFPSTHPPLSETGEPDDPIKEIVEPTPGAAAGDRVRYVQYVDSMYNAPATPYWRSYHAAMNFRGVDIGTDSGRQYVEMRERDLEEYTKRVSESEMTDWALSAMRGCTVQGHSLKLQEDGTMFDMLDRRRLEGGVMVMDKDQAGVPIDRKLNFGKPMSEAEAAKRTTIYRVDNVPFRSEKEVILHVQKLWERRTKGEFHD